MEVQTTNWRQTGIVHRLSTTFLSIVTTIHQVHKDHLDHLDLPDPRDYQIKVGECSFLYTCTCTINKVYLMTAFGMFQAKLTAVGLFTLAGGEQLVPQHLEQHFCMME